MTPRFTLRPPPEDFYVKFTVAGAVFFGVLELLYFAFSSPSFYLPSLDAFGGTAIGRDFLNTWMGGRSAWGEGPAAWFDFLAYNAFLQEFVGQGLHDYVWSYPPHILLFIWPLGPLPYLPAFVLWTALGFSIFLYAAWAGGVEHKHLLFIAVAPAVALNVFFGQNGFFTAALLIGGLANLDRRPVFSGVLFGILSIKPQLGLLLPLVLVLTGRWREILSAAVTIAALVAATAWLYGADIWIAYFKQVVPMQHYLQEHGEGLLFLTIPSFFYGVRLIGLPISVAWGVQALASAVAVAAVIWTFWRRRDHTLAMAFLVTVVFLVTPYAMNYDMVVFGWVLALLRQRSSHEPIDHYLVMAVWTLPATMMIAGLINLPLAPLLLSAFAARLLRQLAQEGNVSLSYGAAVAERAAAWLSRLPARLSSTELLHR